MSWFEQPIRRAPRKINPVEVERRRLRLLQLDRERKRRQLTSKWRAANYQRTTSGLPAMRVIEAWHTDESGCRARVVGCD